MKLCDLMVEELSTGEELKTFREIYVMVSQVIEVMLHLAMKFIPPNMVVKTGPADLSGCFRSALKSSLD